MPKLKIDWEKGPGLKVSGSIVRAYVRNLRKEYDIPKEIKTRDYEAISEPDMEEQIQGDFGETWQETPDKRKVDRQMSIYSSRLPKMGH